MSKQDKPTYEIGVEECFEEISLKQMYKLRAYAEGKRHMPKRLEAAGLYLADLMAMAAKMTLDAEEGLNLGDLDIENEEHRALTEHHDKWYNQFLGQKRTWRQKLASMLEALARKVQ